MDKCVVPGTFDPITKGHLDIIKRASKLANQVVVAIAASEIKNPEYTLEERVKKVKEACIGLDNVEVVPFDCLLVDFVKSQGASCVVRGLRNVDDFNYERNMAAVNKKMHDDFETVFLMSSPENVNISSSQVRELKSLGVDCSSLLP